MLTQHKGRGCVKPNLCVYRDIFLHAYCDMQSYMSADFVMVLKTRDLITALLQCLGVEEHHAGQAYLLWPLPLFSTKLCRT